MGHNRHNAASNFYRGAVAIAVIGATTVAGTGCDNTERFPASIRNDIGMTFVPAGPDTFQMGDANESRTWKLEERQHWVTLSCDFLIGATEVTQEQWGLVMDENPSFFRGDSRPAESISWRQALEFCTKLSEAAGLDPVYQFDGPLVNWDQNANGYRFPTEAEWEYAARAHSFGPFHVGDRLTADDANFAAKHPYGSFIGRESLNRTVPVGSYDPNDWGLHDVHGNVWEWCWDIQSRYPAEPSTNPKGVAYTATALVRSARGGSWSSPLGMCRSAERRYPHHVEPTRNPNPADEPGRQGGGDIGLRLARNPGLPTDATPAAGNGTRAVDRLEQGLGIEMVRIPAGSFLMGSPPDEVGREFSRRRHEVRVTRRFWVATTEVTRGQWRSVMSKEAIPKGRADDALPIAKVSWFDAIEFCNVLSKRERLTPAYALTPAADGHPASVTWDREANGYRLPTEAEWQLAAGPNDATPSESDDTAWLVGNSSGGPRVTGQFPTTGAGIYDARGNVWEWCWDWYGPYPDTTVTDPTGPLRGLARTKRGGSWGSPLQANMYRGGYDPTVDLNTYLGFRIVRNRG